MQELAARAGSGKEGAFGEVFRAFAYGWALHRELEVTYHALTRRAPRTCRFRPYLLEPSVHGTSLYALGHADPPGELRVFKLERVVRARVTDTTFEPIPSGELLSRLEQSWDIWISGSEAVEVRLRFAPKVARAIRETRWHASQRLEALPGGGVEMRLAVASTLELVAGVLGWGGACEVVGPAELRELPLPRRPRAQGPASRGPIAAAPREGRPRRRCRTPARPAGASRAQVPRAGPHPWPRRRTRAAARAALSA